MNRALVIEDDESIRAVLEGVLSESGFSVELAEDGAVGLQLGSNSQFDLILLDVILPSMNGFDVCRLLRENGVTTPILMLTSLDEVEDKIRGLDAGADDYLVKPFAVSELLARSRALMRRSNYGGVGNKLRVADLELDPATRQATRAGKTISFSTTEYALLELLMRNAGRVVPRSELLEGVWQYDFGGQDNVLEVYISYLRRKIDKPFEFPLLQTIRGAGYSITAPAN